MLPKCSLIHEHAVVHLFAQDSVSLVGNSFLSISSPHLQQVVVLCLSGADLIAGHDMYCGSERSVHSSGEKTLIASRRPLLRSSVVAVPLKKRIPRMSPETTDEEKRGKEPRVKAAIRRHRAIVSDTRPTTPLALPDSVAPSGFAKRRVSLLHPWSLVTSVGPPFCSVRSLPPLAASSARPTGASAIPCRRCLLAIDPTDQVVQESR